MALESLPKIAPALFSAEQDLLEIYNKKTDTRGTINPSYIKSSPSGVSGAIQFSDGSAFASDAANLFWDNVNKRWGVGTNAPINNLTVIDSTTGSTSGARGITVGNSNTANALSFGSYFNVGVISGPGGPLMIQTPASNKGVSISTGYLIPTAMAHIQGSGSTSATTSLLVQDSAGNVSFRIKDDGSWSNGGNGNMVLSFGQYWVISGSTSQIGNLISGQGMSYYSSQPFCINVASNQHKTSAEFQIDSTTKGFLPPRMTTTQVNAIASPAVGLMAYNTDLDCPVFYSSGGWRKVSHSAM